jgi:hypothetical protein
MNDLDLRLPNVRERQSHVLESLSMYWPGSSDRVAELPIEECNAAPISGPLRLAEIMLPDWAHTAAVDGRLLVPSEAVGDGSWQRTDWWTAAFIMLEGWHERSWERAHGPVHSYSFRLKGWDERAWQRAWVNRIGMFLALWAGIEPVRSAAAVRVSHDVDAISKTAPIRIKQGAFRTVAAARRRTGPNAATGGVIQFISRASDWWHIDDVLRLEGQAGVVATFNVFADPRRRSPRRWLLDPGYRLDSSEGANLVETLLTSGSEIGLHPSFDSWRNAGLLREQREHLEQHIGRAVRRVRQHWLRFSWERTWAAQATAGLACDTTLMFNDRSGFRNSAAIEWRPWNTLTDSAHEIRTVPSCFMDSHQYDYSDVAGRAPIAARTLVDECRAVGGTAEFLWHPHTLNPDYGWRPGFVELIEAVTRP